MSKGTPSMGRRQKTTHIRCRRCGRNAYHKQKRVCAACGYGATAKMRKYSWSKKAHRPKA
ncbi:MAG TPA: 50S ribosomal protein L37e [Candidatus Poseidoniaceae archaeon]|nr:MAG TPA: 50S ribosomal protein L37e [Candidatus Poseidoniales archaeon]DAC57137.1 MAG TPA: 50S ribosomal protein L37e [Candidatus Poseidoniales archaeon]HII38011.1 50S ribosomal protein L37e [Candidatus Poseidoniaceae archaeon]HII44593.1 50S ribosomal protein L37e [Candidatus Poseidoniaceae archaeon]